LDERDRASGARIPEGFVQVYGFWGLPGGYEVLVTELVYLTTLATALSEAGYSSEAMQVWRVAEQQRHAEPAAPDPAT
jgi:hypothetical protein